ncbi:MAG TPA: hypothetical protein V6D07_08345 [Trichocoleus sp.]
MLKLLLISTALLTASPLCIAFVVVQAEYGARQLVQVLSCEPTSPPLESEDNDDEGSKPESSKSSYRSIALNAPHS